MRKIAIGITSLALLVAIAALVWFGSAHKQLTEAGLDGQGKASARAPQTETLDTEASDEDADSSEDVVEESDVDGDFLLDADGHLIVTEDARHIFDYFLSLNAEESKEQTKQRLLQYIESNLVDPAKTEALQLLERYLQFKQSITELNAETKTVDWLHNGDFSPARERLEQIKNLRRRYFSEEETSALFGGEEAYDEFSLRRLEILQNKTLTDAEKFKQVQQLRELLPDSMRQSVEPQLQQELDEKTQTLRDAGAPEADIRKLREQMVGPDAAARLEVLDKEQQAWNERLDLFRAEKKKIVEDAAISDDVKQKMIESLLEARFSELERQRVEALESE